jgi:hypothetical protein
VNFSLGDYGYSLTKKNKGVKEMWKLDLIMLGDVLYELLKPGYEKYSVNMKNFALSLLNGVCV